MIMLSLSTGLLRPANVSGPDTNYEVFELCSVNIAFRCWTQIVPRNLPRTSIVEKLLRDGGSGTPSSIRDRNGSWSLGRDVVEHLN